MVNNGRSSSESPVYLPMATRPDETRGKVTTMETPTQTALALTAQAGDQEAFETLVGTYRRELLVHCYRMRARSLMPKIWCKSTAASSGERDPHQSGSIWGWLYRIATDLCLNGSDGPLDGPYPRHPPIERSQWSCASHACGADLAGTVSRRFAR